MPKKVKALGCIDFILLLGTIVLISYRIIVPLSPKNDISTTEATRSPAKFRIREWEEAEDNRPYLTSFEYGFVVGVFGIIGAMGIAWSCVLIKVAIYPDIRNQLRVQLLGFWLVCNGIILTFLVYVGVWLFQNGPMDNAEDEFLYSTQIPFLICVLLRLILVYAVWRERGRMLDERRLSNEEIDKWMRYLAACKPKIRSGYHV